MQENIPATRMLKISINLPQNISRNNRTNILTKNMPKITIKIRFFVCSFNLGQLFIIRKVPTTTIRPIIFERSARQFGIPLPEKEIIHQGIGGFLEINSSTTLGIVRPSILFDEKLTLEIDNLTFELAHGPGETDDHLYVYIPEKEAVMVGDNFYRSFANLYAIRGTKFRNPMEWVRSLDKIRTLDAMYWFQVTVVPFLEMKMLKKH